MFLPEQLYLPTQYDYAVGIAPRRYLENNAVTFTAANSNTLFAAVPGNLVLSISHLQIACGPNAATAEVLQSITITITGPAGVSLCRPFVRESFTAAGLGQEVTFTSHVELVLMPTERLVFNVTKSAAVGAFNFYNTAVGVLIPRANIQAG